MSRALIFVFVAITMFLAFFYVSDFFDQPEPVAVVENEVFVQVAFVNRTVNKADPVNIDAIDIREFSESEAKQHSYTPYTSIKIESGALWAKDVTEGTQLTSNLVSNPGEKDYMYLSAKKIRSLITTFLKAVALLRRYQYNLATASALSLQPHLNRIY